MTNLHPLTLMGFSLPDLIGLGIGFMAVALTFVALVGALNIYYMGFRYSRHLSEIERARKELDQSFVFLKQDIKKNSELLREMRLGFSVVAGLVSVRSNFRTFKEIKPETDEEFQRFTVEIENLQKKIKAREIELQIIVNEGEHSQASLVGLSETFGDNSTVEFLEAYAKIREQRGKAADQYYEARGQIRARINSAE